MERKDLVNKICKDFKLKRGWGIAALVIFLIQLFIDLSQFIVILAANDIGISSENLSFSLVLVYIAVLILVVWSIICLIRNRPNGIKMDIKDFMEYKCQTNSSIPEGIFEDMMVQVIFLNPLLVALYAFMLYAFIMCVGGTYGIASIPAIIGYIYYIVAYIDMKKYNNMLPDKLKEKDKKEQEKKIDDAKNLLVKTGKIFFVNYYNELKNFNTIDIIDIIQENYSEDAKKSRIANAKKIFSNNLQIEALNEILENKDGVANQKILDKARILLEKETKVPLAKEIKENNDCNVEKSCTENQGYVKTIIKYFEDKKGLKPRIEVAPNGDEIIVVNYQIKYIWSLCIKIDEDKEMIKIYTPFCKINPSKRDDIYELLSKWNHDFLFVKFFIENTEDGLYIIASNDVPLADEDSVGECVFYIADEFIKAIDNQFGNIPQNIIGL